MNGIGEPDGNIECRTEEYWMSKWAEQWSENCWLQNVEVSVNEALATVNRPPFIFYRLCTFSEHPALALLSSLHSPRERWRISCWFQARDFAAERGVMREPSLTGWPGTINKVIFAKFCFAGISVGVDKGGAKFSHSDALPSETKFSLAAWRLWIIPDPPV